MKTTFLTLISLLLTGTLQAATPGAVTSGGVTPINLEETVRQAIERSPTLQAAKAEVQIRDLERNNSFANFLPSLDLNATTGIRDSSPSYYSSPYGNELSLQLTENLYDNGVNLIKYENAKIQQNIAQLNYNDQRDQLILSVAGEYMKYSLHCGLLEVQQQQFDIINRQFQSVSSQYQQGLRTRRDYLRFKTELRRAEIDLLRSKTQLESSKVELMRLVGYDLAADQQILQFQPVEIDPKAALQVPKKNPELQNHPIRQITELQKKDLENNLSIIKRSYWPELFLTAGAGYRTGDFYGDNTVFADNEATTWNVLLNLKFNLWDWGLRRRNISITRAKNIQAESSLTISLNNLSAESHKLTANVNESSQSFILAQELLDLETNSYRMLESEYRNGKVNYLDIILALRDLLGAKVQMYTSYFELRQQLLKYLYYEGTLHEKFVE